MYKRWTNSAAELALMGGENISWWQNFQNPSPGPTSFFTHWKKLYMKSKKIQQQKNTTNLQKSQKPPHKYFNEAEASKASPSPLYYHVMCHKRPKGQFLHFHSIQGHSQSKSVKTYT